MAQVAGSSTRRGWRAPGVDGLRVLAAVGVVVNHCGYFTGVNGRDTLLGHLTSRLDAAVPVFFAISGLLLGRPFVDAYVHGRRRPSTRSYLRHRFLRIFPLYWVVLVATVLTLDRHAQRSVVDRVLSVFSMHGYSATATPIGLEATWSLTVEVSFYLLLPLAALALIRVLPTAASARGRVIGVLAVCAATVPLSAAWCGVTVGDASLIRIMAFLPGDLDWFAAGIALVAVLEWATVDARVAARLDAVRRCTGPLLLAAAACLLLLSTPLGGPPGLAFPPEPGAAVTRNLLMTGFAGFLVLAASPADPPPIVAALLANPLMRRLADLSYGIFLWHLPVLTAWYSWAHRREFTGSLPSVLAVVLGVTLVLSALSYVAVERPARRLRGRRPAPPARGADRSRQTTAPTHPSATSRHS